MKLDRDLVTAHDVLHYSVCASDLGLRPGEWPEQIDTNLGNGQPLILRDEPRGEGAGCVYTQQFGCIQVTVWND